MENENTTTIETVPSPEEVLVKMKETMVPKEEAENWQNKYNELFVKFAAADFSNNAEAHVETNEEKYARVTKEIENLHTTKRGSLAHMQALVDFDDERRAEGQRSIFVNTRGDVDLETQQFADDFNKLLKDTIKIAEGDDAVASTYLVSRLDSFPMAR